MDNQPSVLIISRSAQLRSSLEVLITSSARVKSIHLEGDLNTIAGLAANYTPALVVLAFEPAGGNIRSVLGQIKAVWPHTPIIVFVDQERDLPEAISAGATAVLMKGILAANLLKIIEDLLPDG